jgi:hypothetical protein
MTRDEAKRELLRSRCCSPIVDRALHFRYLINR